MRGAGHSILWLARRRKHPLWLTWYAGWGVLNILVARSSSRLGLSLSSRLGARGCYASSLCSSFSAPPALLFGLPLLLCFLALPACVHDHLRRANIGAVSLRDWHWTASGARTAIGCAPTRQIAHLRVLFHQIRRERVRDADCLLKNKSDSGGGAPRDAKGWMRLE